MSHEMKNSAKPNITCVNNLAKAIETNLTMLIEFMSKNYAIIYFSVLSIFLSYENHIDVLNLDELHKTVQSVSTPSPFNTSNSGLLKNITDVMKSGSKNTDRSTNSDKDKITHYKHM